MPRFVEAGFIPPNPPAQDTFLKTKSFPEAMKIINTYQRRTYGVPFFQGLRRAPQTWDEVIDYCQKVTKKDATGKLTRAGIGLRLFGGGSGVGEKWWFWLYPAGGTIIEARPGGRYRAGYNNQAGRDALKLYVDLIHKYRCDDPTLKRDAEAFAMEQAAMFTRESWVIGFLRTNNPGLLYTTAPLPRYRRAGTIINSVNLYVTRSAKNPDVAWDFVNFILRPENQQVLLETVGWMPGEDRLGDHRPAQHGPKIEPDNGHDRDGGILERVPEEHVPFPHPFGPSRADVVLSKHLQEARAHQACGARHEVCSQRDGRENQVPPLRDRHAPLRPPRDHGRCRHPLGLHRPPFQLGGTAAILLIAYFIRRLPYTFRSSFAALMQTDVTLKEASLTCGASQDTTFRRITLPLIAPGILAGATITFATLLGELTTTLLLYSARWKTISVKIFEFISYDQTGPASALGALLVVAVLVTVFIANRLSGQTLTSALG